MAGDDRVFSTAAESLRKRVPWLEVNLVTAFLAASVVALFEGAIKDVPALAVFMPVVAGMGGNAATQTLTVIVRGIALGELTWANSRKALFKEARRRPRQRPRLRPGRRAGRLGLEGELWLGADPLRRDGHQHVRRRDGRARSIPLALRAMKVDPALASSVFITTLTDVFGFASWLGLSTLFITSCCTGG